MRCPKRGEAFKCEKEDTIYLSVVDKCSDVIRCISSESKKQTAVGRCSVCHIFTPEESQAMLKDFFE